jgi:hypothetical protein
VRDKAQRLFANYSYLLENSPSQPASGVLNLFSMHSFEPRFSLFLLLVIAPMTVIAAQSAKSIKEGECTAIGAHVVFFDGTQRDFPAGENYQCADFKISADHRFAGWKVAGTLIAESDSQKQTYPDATLYVLAEGESYAATENARYINDWYFVPEHAEVVAETAFEHGPSTYILYDIANKKMLETCGQFELAQCRRLEKLVNLDN